MLNDIPKDPEKMTEWFNKLYSERPWMEIYAPGAFKARDEAFAKVDQMLEAIQKEGEKEDE